MQLAMGGVGSAYAWARKNPALMAPDLIHFTSAGYRELANTFLVDFGMQRAARTGDALYMRGTDGQHHVHVTHRGEPGFLGFAFHAASAARASARPAACAADVPLHRRCSASTNAAGSCIRPLRSSTAPTLGRCHVQPRTRHSGATAPNAGGAWP